MPSKIIIQDPITKQTVDGVFEPTRFSVYRCFPMSDLPVAQELALLQRMGRDLLNSPEKIALYKSGPFLDYFLDHFPELTHNIAVIIDPLSAVSIYRGLPCVTRMADWPAEVKTVFLCETRTELLWRLPKQLPKQVTILSPAIASQYLDLLPASVWIPSVQTIYPFNIPEISIRQGLDLLLLDLPSRVGWQIPVGTAYVYNALQRAEVNYQLLDTDMILYHRYHIHRLFDLGHPPVLRNHVSLTDDPWDWLGHERIWMEPKLWPFLIDFFKEFIDEILEKYVAASPKILAMSVHQRNEWITRELARRVKKTLPETIILVGGHSCCTPSFGVGAFPEYDYMVIGEADLVVGPLVKKLATGQRPTNLPGVVSKFDSHDHIFVPAPISHNIDSLGTIPLEAFGDVNAIYRTWNGGQYMSIPLTRGCVWARCTFCAERFAFRSRTPKHYVDEIQQIVDSGLVGRFGSSDSDFGGNPEVLYQVLEEIVRRGLKISLSPQMRLNKKYNVDFFKLMRAAGVTWINFGNDAFTMNTIRLQRKGYTMQTLMDNHRDCVQAGITPAVNVVIGVPGETDADIVETVRVLAENKDIFPSVHNINNLSLASNSVYWESPEEFNIFFYGQKEEIFRKYYWGVPSRLWYSIEPFIDHEVRCTRMAQLIRSLHAANVIVSNIAMANFHDLQLGRSIADIREDLLNHDLKLHNENAIVMPKKPAFKPVYLDHLIAAVCPGNYVSINYDPIIDEIFDHFGIQYWVKGENKPAKGKIFLTPQNVVPNH